LESSGGIPWRRSCESFDALREARASKFGRPTGTWQDVTRGRVPRYGRAPVVACASNVCHARQSATLSHSQLYGEDDEHCDRDGRDLGLRRSCPMWALRSLVRGPSLSDLATSSKRKFATRPTSPSVALTTYPSMVFRLRSMILAPPSDISSKGSAATTTNRHPSP